MPGGATRAHGLLEEAGVKVTQRTLDTMREREKAAPGAVQTVVVHLRQELRPESLDFLQWAERNQSNRESRYAIAVAHASRAQRGVRDFLWNDRAVRDCFRESRDFFFEPARMIKTLPVTNALLVPANSRLVERLQQHESVLAVQHNFAAFPIPGERVIDPANVVPLAGAGSAARHTGGYTWGWSRLGVPSVHKDVGLTGRGVTIGVVNTGVCEDHPDLVFKVKDFAKVEPSGRVVPAHSFDLEGHGTHCAGVMAGAGSSGVQIGGAPSAELKAVSIMDGRQAWASSLFAALDWLADPYRSVDVINLSLGIAEPSPDEKVILESAVSRISLQGIALVAAIGNERTRSMYPARLGNVIGCGALTADGHVWESSGTAPDFILPGESIYSCLPPLNPHYSGRTYGWFTGSSMACAHMTALVALFMEARPDAGPAFIMRAFRETAGNGGVYDERSGWGIPNLLRAIEFRG